MQLKHQLIRTGAAHREADEENAKMSFTKLSPPPVVKFSSLNSNFGAPNASLAIETNYSIEKQEKKQSNLKKVMEKRLKHMNGPQQGIRMTMGKKELNGTLRFLAEGFATNNECNELLQLAQIAAVQGDGYNGKSPHTENEKFEGVTLGRAALLVYFGFLDPQVLDIFLKLSERVKDFVQKYFKLKNKLYFTFTHLVCRTALPTGSETRNQTDLSHAVHADNCNLQPNGDCIFAPPAYTWRSFSAILYLNDDFEGGEFIFASDMQGHNIQNVIQPKCGRLVGFSAGKENLHGVKAVRRGSRCALGLWYTFDPNYQEVERILAEKVMVEVQKHGTISDKLFNELQKYVSVN